MTIRRVVVVFCVVLAIGVGGAKTAEANFANSLSGNCYYSYVTECYADSSKHDFYWDLGARGEAAVFSTLFGSYDTTDLDVSLASGHTASVDVFYDYGDVPDVPEGAAVGLWSCQTWNGHRCDHGHVIFDGAQISGYSDDKLKWLACHETGHSVGLTHPSDDSDGLPVGSTVFACMRYSPFPSNLGGHNVGHIDGYYL